MEFHIFVEMFERFQKSSNVSKVRTEKDPLLQSGSLLVGCRQILKVLMASKQIPTTSHDLMVSEQFKTIPARSRNPIIQESPQPSGGRVAPLSGNHFSIGLGTPEGY